MIRLAMGLAALAAAAQSGKDEGKPSHPAYQVTVTAKTKFARWKDAYQEFQDRLKKILPGVKYLGTDGVEHDKAGWERWQFQAAWDAKFDQAKFARLFGEMKIGKIEIGLRGEASIDMKSRTITVTAFGEKIKVKLLNRPKKDFNDAPENVLAKFAEAYNAGKKFFHVRGEVLSSGEVWAMYLDDYTPVDGPKK